MIFEEFMNLKTNDKIKVKGFSGTFIVIDDPFYNYDSDEPDWEILTNNGYVSICNEIKKIT